MKSKFLTTTLRSSAIVALLAVTGCAEYNRRVLTHTEERGSEFTRTLSKEYETLGTTEQKIMYDDCSADYYYRKAICAKQGIAIGPTPLWKWNIEPDRIPELVIARERLMRAIQFGARDVAPKMTAYSQAHFDCWVEQQAEGWQRDDIAWCRGDYYSSISEVELMLMGGIQKVTPENMVFFDFNSSHLNADSMLKIDEIAAMAMESSCHILLVGRTDQIGDVKHNKNLSKHRAMAVKKELIRRGVSPHFIAIKAAGEAPGPKVDMHNRRVDIIFLNY